MCIKEVIWQFDANDVCEEGRERANLSNEGKICLLNKNTLFTFIWLDKVDFIVKWFPNKGVRKTLCIRSREFFS